MESITPHYVKQIICDFLEDLRINIEKLEKGSIREINKNENNFLNLKTKRGNILKLTYLILENNNNNGLSSIIKSNTDSLFTDNYLDLNEMSYSSNFLFIFTFVLITGLVSSSADSIHINSSSEIIEDEDPIENLVLLSEISDKLQKLLKDYNFQDFELNKKSIEEKTIIKNFLFRLLFYIQKICLTKNDFDVINIENLNKMRQYLKLIDSILEKFSNEDDDYNIVLIQVIIGTLYKEENIILESEISVLYHIINNRSDYKEIYLPKELIEKFNKILSSKVALNAFFILSKLIDNNVTNQNVKEKLCDITQSLFTDEKDKKKLFFCNFGPSMDTELLGLTIINGKILININIVTAGELNPTNLKQCSYFLIILIHQIGHIIIRKIKPLLLDLFDHSKDFCSNKFEESGYKLEEILFEEAVYNFEERIAKFLLNENNWDMSLEEFKSQYKKITGKKAKISNSNLFFN